VTASRLTVLNLPAAYWQALGQWLRQDSDDDTALGDTRCVIVGSEAVKVESTIAWQRQFGHRIALYNAYGPTEATVTATILRVPADPRQVREGAAGQELPIGRPIANTLLYILDAEGEPVPIGVPGEIHIGGAQLARGYLNQPQLTTDVFVPDPYSGRPEARMYRTGDLGRWRADGIVEFLGRNDFQVKIRGFRIELGEIEARLIEHPAVTDAVVMAHQQPGGQGDPRLLAYVAIPPAHTARPVHTPPGVEALRLHLRSVLPDYMVPTAIVVLPELPRTAHGKLDRAALPEPDSAALAQAAFEPPYPGMEAAIASIWRALLGVARVGRNDDFFALGGHSLLALDVVRALRVQLNRRVSVDQLLRNPTLSDLALAVGEAAVEDENAAALTAIPALTETDRVPLTPMQRRQWFLFRLEGASPAWNMANAYRLEGHLDEAAMRAALRDVVERHWILRSRLEQPEGAELPQLAVGPLGDVPMDFVVCAAAQATAHIAGFLARPFDLSTEPLSRFELLQVDDGRRYLLANIHHIGCDGLSLRTLLRDVTQAYGARARGELPCMPERTIQFAELAALQAHARDDGPRRQALAELVEALRDAPQESALPLDRPRGATAGRAAQRVEFVWDRMLSEGLHRLAGAHGTTTFSVLLASWAWVMSRQRRQDELVIGVPIVCRDQPGSEDVIGPLLNTLAVRIDCAAVDTFVDLLSHTTAALAFARDRRDVPFEDLVEALNPSRSLNLSPLFQVQFVLDPVDDEILTLESLQAHPLSHEDLGLAPGAKYDLNIHLLDGEGALRGYVDYRSVVYHQASVQAAIEAWRCLLEQVCGNPGARLRELGLMDEPTARTMASRVERIDATLPLDLP
ncbi:MAG TPA: condensation domain-containing protein, partial [Chitinolyticbacter sp.]|nr:condensation domain-containing protein [Chitinolyticbacter sp.]